MLRAVLSVEECHRLVSQSSLTYVGDQFPSVADHSTTRDFAVLSVHSDEATGQWRPGYYCVDSDLTELNNALRDLAR